MVVIQFSVGRTRMPPTNTEGQVVGLLAANIRPTRPSLFGSNDVGKGLVSDCIPV